MPSEQLTHVKGLVTDLCSYFLGVCVHRGGQLFLTMLQSCFNRSLTYFKAVQIIRYWHVETYSCAFVIAHWSRSKDF